MIIISGSDVISDSSEKNYSILIVDDDTANLMELNHILRNSYKLRMVKDGKNAIRNASEFLPDIILLDVVMPEMNGFEVLAELKKSEKTKDIPVIFVTGMKDVLNEKEGFALGAVDYIRKPFNIEDVKNRILVQLAIKSNKFKLL